MVEQALSKATHVDFLSLTSVDMTRRTPEETDTFYEHDHFEVLARSDQGDAFPFPDERIPAEPWVVSCWRPPSSIEPAIVGRFETYDFWRHQQPFSMLVIRTRATLAVVDYVQDFVGDWCAGEHCEDLVLWDAAEAILWTTSHEGQVNLLLEDTDAAQLEAVGCRLEPDPEIEWGRPPKQGPPSTTSGPEVER